MGLISDRRNKAKQAKNESSSSSSSAGSKMKKGLFGGSSSHMFPLASPNRGGSMVPKYPPGYYTTPVNHSSSWSHPGQPKFHPNVNPRYQTWVAPRKQPALGQLVNLFFACPLGRTLLTNDSLCRAKIPVTLCAKKWHIFFKMCQEKCQL